MIAPGTVMGACFVTEQIELQDPKLYYDRIVEELPSRKNPYSPNPSENKPLSMSGYTLGYLRGRKVVRIGRVW